MLKNNYTRGFGLFEGFIAVQRHWLANRLIEKKQRRGKLLDLGCGATPQFLMRTEFAKKYGLERTVVNLNGHKIKLVGHNLDKKKRLPFQRDFFDVVTMLAVIEHIEPENVVFLLKEVKRILKPNGRLIITTPAPWTEPIMDVIAKMRISSPAEVDEHKRTYNHKALLECLCKAGFSKEKVKGGYYLFTNNWLYVDN